MKICPQCGTEYELDQRFCPKDGSTLKTQGGATGDLLGSIIADRYHVLRKLGEGGMGTVYLAEHVKMGRKSAVKVMNPDMVHEADAISRFNREAANASRINHPNVAAIYDFGETTDGIIYLAMEFIEGPSLTKVIQELGSLPPMRAADITRQAADALSVAHEMGIVHRDLKPDNIMLTKNRDGSDCVKVVDFGIAKAADNEAQKVTKTGLVVGTPEYMSPEQLAGDKLDGRSDTYSLALVAFSMFTGKLPFPAATAQEAMIMRLTDRPKTLAEMKANVPWSAEVQTVMDRALERDAPGRYATATDFGRELYKAVQAMPRQSDATKAFTALMPPPAVGAHAAGAAVPHSATAPRRSTPVGSISEVPSTRVSKATPVDAPAVRESRGGSGAGVPARRAKTNYTPMIAGIAAVVIAIAGVGYYMKVKSGSADTPTQQGEIKTAALNQPVAAPPANVDAELDQIARLTDVSSGSSATAGEALQRLDRLAAETMTADQKVRAALRRAEANTIRDDKRAACKAVQEVEGLADTTKYKRSVALILKSAC